MVVNNLPLKIKSLGKRDMDFEIRGEERVTTYLQGLERIPVKILW